MSRRKITLSLTPEAWERFEMLFERLKGMGVCRSKSELFSDLTGWALNEKGSDQAFWARVKTWHLEAKE